MTRFIYFRSQRFQPDPGEDEEVNPGIYGKKLASWITEVLPGRGIATNRMYPEDWGWEIDISTDGAARYLGVRNLDGTDSEWVVSIDIKNSLLKKLFGKSQDEEKEIDQVIQALEPILQSEGTIQDLNMNYDL